MSWNKKEFIQKKRSNRNLDANFSGINNELNIDPISNNQPSPSFKAASSKERETVTFKTPHAVQLDRVIVVNNDDYLENAKFLSYKQRTVNKSSETLNKLKYSSSKNSKSEERLNSEYINIEDGKTKQNQ